MRWTRDPKRVQKTFWTEVVQRICVVQNMNLSSGIELFWDSLRKMKRENDYSWGGGGRSRHVREGGGGSIAIIKFFGPPKILRLFSDVVVGGGWSERT